MRAVRVLLALALVAGCAAAGGRAASRPSADPRCFGAAALAHPQVCAPSTRSGPITPSAARAFFDRSNAYPSKAHNRTCFAVEPAFALTTCVFGPADARTQVALIGNSHAAQWLPAVEAIAAQRGWRVTTYLASQCALADVLQGFRPPPAGLACLRWTRDVVDRVVATRPALVLMSNKVSRGVRGLDLPTSRVRFRAGYAHVVSALVAHGLTVVGLRDTPSPAFQVPRCLQAHPDDYDACDGPRAVWLTPEPLVEALAMVRSPRAVLVDLTDRICPTATCAAVVGGVPVYFDVSHLTATYARTLAPYLAEAIDRALRQTRRTA